MDAVLRALIMYAFLMLLFRVSGRRTFSEITSFDFILLLIIGDATQQALLGDDFSLTNAMLVIITLVIVDVLLSLAKRRAPRVDRLLEGLPMILVDHGRPLDDLMYKARVDREEVMHAARIYHGLERMDQIKYAVLERSGGITIVPADSG